MDQRLNDILETIDFFYEISEKPEILKQMDINHMKKLFQACVCIENAMKKVQEENKEKYFESHLNAWMSKKKKTIEYKCSNLKNACDKMLEYCFKEEQIPNEIIDELLKMYIQQCGSTRLETNINHLLTNSMQANNILHIFKNLEFSENDIEDELLIASWEHEIQIGKRKKVIECLRNKFTNEHVFRLIELAFKSETKSSVNTLILDFFSKKLIDNNVLLYSQLKDAKKKVILKLLTDNDKFQVSFVDATFYIGRNMEPDDAEMWITNTGLTYDDLKYMIQILLDGPENLYNSIINRIKIAKELDKVWQDIENDCIL